jgi:hypothetical protein
MIDEGLRQELVAMRAEDMRVRAELVASGELGGPYVPRMEAVHRQNAARLRELIAQHGWPAADIAGDDGAEAAWLIAQHAIGEPEFQRDVLQRLLACAAEERVPRWHAAYLEDRIALHEGRPQRFGSQWVDDPIDGRARPWQIADPARIDEVRAEVGLGPMPTIPERGPELPLDERRRREADHRWWLEWLASRGWSPS